MAALTQGNYVVGSAAIIRAGGIPVGNASGITISVGIQNNRIYTMGSPFPKEIIGGNVSVTVSVEQFFIYADSPIVQGLFPGATPASVWSSPYLDFEVVDADDTAPVFGALRCKPSNLTVAVSQSGIMGANQSFDGTWYKDDRPFAAEG